MDDQEFIRRLKAKIEGLTGSDVQLHLDMVEKHRIKIDLEGPVPEVTLGSNVVRYSGFARMAAEYVVASIREKRELGPLEFHVLLARN